MKLLDVLSELTESESRWWPFEKARDYVRNLNLKNQLDWVNYYKSGEKPREIPASPKTVYGDQFIGYGDWLGTNVISNRVKNKQFWSFEKAREYIHGLDLKDIYAWYEYTKSGEKPIEIPTDPAKAYSEKFKGYGDWLGTFSKGGFKKRGFLPFEEAREFVRGLNISTMNDWYEYTKSAEKPNNIPTTPHQAYPERFISYSDWLGTFRISTKDKGKIFLPYENARTYANTLNLKTKLEYANWAMTKNRPITIPAAPDKFYKGNGWVNWYDWLVGSPYVTDDEFKKQYNIQDKPNQFVSFVVARDLARDLNLNSKEEWYRFIKNNKPQGLPIKPQEFYKEHWTNWEDFLNINDI